MLTSLPGLLSPLVVVCLLAPAPFPRQRAEPAMSYLGVDVRPAAGGLQIVGSYIGTPAADAGLDVEEVIESIDGMPTPSVAALTAILRKKQAGESVTVEMNSGGERRKVMLKLAPRKPYPLLGTFQSNGRVMGFIDDSPARRAGIKEEDVILSLGKFKVNVTKDVADAMAQLRAGEVVDVTLLRNGTEMKVPVKLGARPGY